MPKLPHGGCDNQEGAAVILVGTILQSGAAFAVYADGPVKADEIISEHATDCDGCLVFDSRVRLVAVYDEPPPDVLPDDISASVHDRP